ncbi:MAG: endonuclease/exonuclease/phosphatase [Anaerolineaceae bacterium]|nr:MAG: endonuclease/exonuclease/phosphatase [Anaerolineaceae bacterium]
MRTINRILSGVLIAIFVLGLTFIPGGDAQAASCTWTGAVDTAWGTAGNWSCGAVPGAADDVVIDGSVTAAPTITAVSTTTIKSLTVTNNAAATLTASAAATVTVNGGGTGLTVASGSSLTFGGGFAITMALASGTSGTVSGAMTMTGTASAAHRLTGFAASPITFQSGAVFTAGTNFSGNAFGTANLNSVIFASGSTYTYQAGSNPFGASQPSSVVVFQTGSLYKHLSSNTPSFSGRTYANFELDFAAANISGTGTGALSIDNLTITSGRLNLNMTGTFNLKGSVSVAGGATLTFTPASAATLTFSGAAPQTISGSGTLTFGANENVAVNSNLTFQKNISIPGTLTVNGTLNIASGYSFTLARDISVPGALNVSGTLNTGTYLVTGAGSFALASGATLGIGSPDGITASGASGNIQAAGTRAYDPGANYIYSGAAAQHAGNGLTGANTLTINNALGVTLDTSVSVTGGLALTSGDLFTGSNVVDLGSAATVTGAGDVVGTVSHTSIPSAGIYYFNNATTFIQTDGSCSPFSITLTKSAPSGLPLAIAREYQIPPSTCTVEISLGYQQSEVGSIPENNLRPYLSITGPWSVQPGSVDTANNFVTTTSLSTFFGDWAIAAYNIYPTGTGSATPAAVFPGDTSLLEVQVVPGVNPSSPVNVACDLTPIGGSASQSLTESTPNTFTYTATVAVGTSGGLKTLVCTVSDDLARSATTNISLTVSTQPDLTVSLAAPSDGIVNVPYDYTLTVSNIGAAAASGITVQFTLPAGLTYNSATVSNGFTAGESGGVVTFSGGSITASNAAILTVNVTATTPGVYTAPADTAIADPSNAIAESNESNNGSAEVTTTIPAPTNPSGVGSADPGTVAQTAPTLLTVAVTPGLYPTSTGLGVTCDLTAIGGSNPTVFTDAGGNTFTYAATVSDDTPAGAKSLPCAITDAEGRTGSASISLTVLAVLPIGTVNGPILDTDVGAAHQSPYKNQTVVVRGVIFEKTLQPIKNSTAVYYGFFIQNTAATADADPNTSDGLYVYMNVTSAMSAPGGGAYTPAVGDEVILQGKITEYYNMTELTNPVLIAPVVRSGVDLDAELPPFIADPPVDLADANRYWERRQGMRAQVPANAIVLGGRSVFNPTDGEVWIAHPNSVIALRTEPYERRAFRDSAILDDNYDPINWDGNGYRILMGSWGIKWTEGNGQALIVPASTFDTVTNAPVGGVNYSYSKYRIEVTTQPILNDGVDPAANNPPQTFDRGLAYSIADFNLENLYDFRDNPFSGCDFTGNTGCPAVAPFLSAVNPPYDYVPADDATYQARLTDIALQIINDLHSPDILAVQEVENQDICVVTGGALVCGSTDNADGKPDALQELALRIAALGGPVYDAAFDRNSSDLRGIAPAFLYRTDRVQLVSPAGDPLLGATPAIVYAGAGVPSNSDISNPKTLNAVLPAGVSACEINWVFPRAPDVGLFRIYSDAIGGSNYRDVYVINNHFKSGPDTCVAHRTEQANYNAAIVAFLQSANPDARVIVVGDLNVYPRPDNTAYGATDQLAALYDPSIGLTNLWDVLNAAHPASAYSYVYLGMAQTLDQMFVNQTLLADLQQYNIAHINSDFPADYTGDVARGTSDHDPNVAVFEFNQAPTALNLSNTSVAGNMPVGTLVGLFSTVDPDAGETFTYTLVPGAGDTDNASFSIAGDQLRTAAVFNALVKNTYLIRARTTDSGRLWFEQTFVITVTANNYVPSIITPANGEHLLTNRPDFDWTDVPGARFYQWQVSRYPNFSVLHSWATTIVSQYTPARELFFPEQLYWRVRAYGPWGFGPWTTASTFFTANAPRTPVLVSPAINALIYDYTPRLDWALPFLPAGTTLDYYQVQVATDVAFSALVINEKVYGLVNSEYTPLTNLNPNTKYYWRVRAFNTAGEYTGWSLTRYFRTAIAPPVLNTPPNGSATTNRRPTFDWNDASGATFYALQVSRNSTFTSLVFSVNVTSSTFTPLVNLPLGTLYWRVRAYGPNGPSLWSSTFNFIEQ